MYLGKLIQFDVEQLHTLFDKDTKNIYSLLTKISCKDKIKQ